MGPLGPLGRASAAEQDYYFLSLFIGVLLASAYRFGSIRRVLQVGALALIPLPTLIFLFDPIEFNTFFASALDTMGLPWFSNAVLLYVSVGVLIVATVYPMGRRFASRALERVQTLAELAPSLQESETMFVFSVTTCPFASVARTVTVYVVAADPPEVNWKYPVERSPIASWLVSLTTIP